MADDADPTTELTDEESSPEPAGRRAATASRNVRGALVVGLLLVFGVAAMASWLGYQVIQEQHNQELRALLLSAARQGAVNLTTINYTRADADVQRILNGSTGEFYSNFQQRSPAFIDVVRRMQSQSEGKVTEAGLQSQQGEQAQVLVAVMVKTSSVGAPDQPLRAWRMRISVQKVSADAKMSNVEFVP